MIVFNSRAGNKAVYKIIIINYRKILKLSEYSPEKTIVLISIKTRENIAI